MFEQIITDWRSKNIELNNGASSKMIKQLEKDIDFEFPEDFKTLYLQVNGFKDRDWTSNMFSLFPIERIREEYNYKSNDKYFVPICDFLISSHLLGYIKKGKKIYNDYNQLNKVCNNIYELIELINLDSEKVYL